MQPATAVDAGAGIFAVGSGSDEMCIRDRVGDRPENIEDKANWGVTVIAKGIHIGKNAKVPAKAMIEKDVPEVSGDVE